MYNVYMSNFPPPLPPYLSPNALAALWALLNPIIGNVTGTWSISGYQWNVDRPLAAQIEVITRTINDRISDLSTVPRLQLPAAYQALRDLIKQRQIWLDELEKGRKDNVGPRLDDLRDIVKGSDTKMDKDCITALDDFWKEGNPKPPGSGFPPTEGTDYFLGTPYISLKDFLQGPPIPGASPVFLYNIRAATAPENNAIIQAAYADLLDIENFSGAMVNVWQPSPPLVYNPRKTPRVLTTTWRVWDIIKAM